MHTQSGYRAVNQTTASKVKTKTGMESEIMKNMKSYQNSQLFNLPSDWRVYTKQLIGECKQNLRVSISESIKRKKPHKYSVNSET